MVPENQLSEEAQWLLKNLKKIQDDFAKEIGMLLVLVSKNGEPILPLSPPAAICQLIQKVKEEAEKCGNCYRDALTAFKSGQVKEPFLLNCHMNFAAMIFPIKMSNNEVMGAIIGCGGVFSEEDRTKTLEILQRAAIPEDIKSQALEMAKQIQPISQEELKKRAGILSKLVGILTEESALREVFESA
jgi:ligand-binding sensor protein